MRSRVGPHSTPLDAIRSGGLVPLYSSADPQELYRLAELIVGAGIPVMEVTLRTAGVLEAFGELVARVEEDGLPLLVGAGTVLDRASTDTAISAGAQFIFSPVVDPEVAARCREQGVAWIPGCATPTEIHTAMALECAGVKLFPADAIGGPGFLRSVTAVFPDIKPIPSGGVVSDPDVLRDWLEAGAVAVAMGSGLFPRQAIATGDWSEVQRNLDEAVAAVAEAREGMGV